MAGRDMVLKKQLEKLLKTRKACVEVGDTGVYLVITDDQAEFVREALNGGIRVTFNSKYAWIESTGGLYVAGIFDRDGHLAEI